MINGAVWIDGFNVHVFKQLLLRSYIIIAFLILFAGGETIMDGRYTHEKVSAVTALVLSIWDAIQQVVLIIL